MISKPEDLMVDAATPATGHDAHGFAGLPGRHKPRPESRLTEKMHRS